MNNITDLVAILIDNMENKVPPGHYTAEALSRMGGIPSGAEIAQKLAGLLKVLKQGEQVHVRGGECFVSPVVVQFDSCNHHICRGHHTGFDLKATFRVNEKHVLELQIGTEFKEVPNDGAVDLVGGEKFFGKIEVAVEYPGDRKFHHRYGPDTAFGAIKLPAMKHFDIEASQAAEYQLTWKGGALEDSRKLGTLDVCPVVLVLQPVSELRKGCE